MAHYMPTRPYDSVNFAKVRYFYIVFLKEVLLPNCMSCRPHTTWTPSREADFKPGVGGVGSCQSEGELMLLWGPGGQGATLI